MDIYIYIYIYLLAVYFVPTVRKSSQHFHRAFRSMLMNGRRINRKYIATNSFICVITIFRIYNMEENGLILLLYERK